MVQTRIKVKIHTSAYWYKSGEVHEVLNHVVFGFNGGTACFEKGEGAYGIELTHCEALSPVPEYTMQELIEKIGHEFIIKT